MSVARWLEFYISDWELDVVFIYIYIYRGLSVAMSVILVVLSYSSFRLSVAMSVIFVMSSYSSFYVRMHHIAL